MEHGLFEDPLRLLEANFVQTLPLLPLVSRSVSVSLPVVSLSLRGGHPILFHHLLLFNTFEKLVLGQQTICTT